MPTLQIVVTDPLLALVTSKARAKMLEALFSLPRRSYFQQELSRVLDLRLVEVQRELKRLVAAGLVRAEEAAGRKTFVANERSAIHPDLVSIVSKLRGVAPQLRPAVHGADAAWIFGSFASRSATATSDVDLMVLGKLRPRELRARIGRVEKKMDRTINEHVLEPVEWTRRLAAGDAFIREVRRAPRLWIVGDEDRLERLDPTR